MAHHIVPIQQLSVPVVSGAQDKPLEFGECRRIGPCDDRSEVVVREAELAA